MSACVIYVLYLNEAKSEECFGSTEGWIKTNMLSIMMSYSYVYVLLLDKQHIFSNIHTFICRKTQKMFI